MKNFITKLFCSITAAVLLTFGASAQTAIEKPTFLDNTYIGVTVGADAQVHDWDFNGATAGIRVGKMVTPHFGIEVMGQARFNDFYKRINSHRVGINALGNLNGLFFDGKRDVVEFSPYVGIGWQRNYAGNKHFAPNTNDMYTAMGVYIDFNVSDKVFLTVAPQIAYVLTGPKMQYNGQGPSVAKLQYNINRADIGVIIGAAYRFGNYFKPCNKRYTQVEWDELNDRVNQLHEANLALANALQACESRPAIVSEVGVTEIVPVFPNIGFEQGSAKILGTNLLNLRDIAEFINKTDCKYSVVGFASMEGTERFNQELSVARAQAVAKALIDLGVPEDRLEVGGQGATDQFGPDYEFNRVVIVAK